MRQINVMTYEEKLGFMPEVCFLLNIINDTMVNGINLETLHN